MSRIFHSRIGHYLCWISMLSVLRAAVIGSAQTACHSTPSAAIESLKASLSPSPALHSSGYRVIGIQSDPVLDQRWAMVVSCEHVEWPVLAVQIGASDVAAPSQRNQIRTVSFHSIPMVHAGETVRLWKQEDFLRIEVAGVAEESGNLGKTIQVRLLPQSTDVQWVPKRCSGIVRGPSDVEIQP
jgi:hypothetical protein